MVALLPAPELQFVDADGHPYAGGTLETYTPGTSTPKTTWVDHTMTSANENPIVLDAAGRCIVFGDGAYRVVLRDAAGNLVYDQYSDTIVSAAMQPVMSAATLADARNLLGVDDAIAAEAAARASGDSTEQAARISADTDLSNRINNEVTRATTKEADLQGQIDTITGTAGPTPVLPAGYSFRFGSGVSDGSGNINATFSPPFPTACDTVVTCATGASWWAGVTGRNSGGFTGVTSSPLHGGSWNGPFGYSYIAIGH